MMELALLENLQREDLNPMEEAMAYQMLMNELNVTQEQLAKRLGKSRPYIANYTRLLTLPSFVQDMIASGKLSMAHGRTLLTIKDEEQLKSLLKRIEKEGLNVRQLEKIVQEINQRVSRETKKKKKERNIFFIERETILREKFGTEVKIKETKKEKGKIEIEFFNKEDLNRILELLSGGTEKQTILLFTDGLPFLIQITFDLFLLCFGRLHRPFSSLSLILYFEAQKIP